ncbi:hypothetical protein J1N35_019755 [Gossypium stocksii]|uniref:Uncharacterized protein n=1 Tax=Gossypium stocksii TaxID=47602 RepID=A0A9D3VCM2_9ROSI|nr:hypothetical protein J1N35_019755 [Gossypium stocksii]
MESVLLWLFHGLPVPSQELSHVSCAKARVLWLLVWKTLREAGFTEQRKLPPLGSGRITGRCHLDPTRSAYNFEGDARSLIKQLEQGESEYIDLILDDRRRLGDNIKTCFRHCLASLDI